MIRGMVLTLAACLMLGGTAMAADLKIGVADMQTAGAQSEANQNAKNKYETQFNKEANQLNKQKEDFDKKAKGFESQRATMNQKTMEERVMALRKEAQEIGEKEMMLQQKVGMTQGAIAQDLAQLAIDAAAEVAKQKGFDLVLAQNSVLFANQSFDVTNDVLQAMNRIWKANGSKSLGASAAAAPAQPKSQSSKKK